MQSENELDLHNVESITSTVTEALAYSPESLDGTESESNDELCTALVSKWIKDLGIGQPGGPKNVILDLDTWGYELVVKQFYEQVEALNEKRKKNDQVNIHLITLQDCETINERFENLDSKSPDYQQEMDRLTGASILDQIPENESRIAIAIRGFGNDNIQVPESHQEAYSKSRGRFKAESRKDGWRLHYFCTEENARMAGMSLQKLMNYELKALIAADQKLEVKAKNVAEAIGKADRITVCDKRQDIEEEYRMNLSIGVEDVEAYASYGNVINILGAEAFSGPKYLGLDENGDPILDINGTFATDTHFIYKGEKVTRIRFDIKGGKVDLDSINLEIERNDEATRQRLLNQLIRAFTPTTLPAKVEEDATIVQPKALRNMIGEFGIGLNPLIPIGTGNMMLIEKMLGFHLGVGDAYKDFVNPDGLIHRAFNNVISDTHFDIASANYDNHLDIVFEFPDRKKISLLEILSSI